MSYNPAHYFRSGYIEPRELGCRCDECPLGEYHRQCGTFRPVPPEVHAPTEEFCVVAEMPGPREVDARRPLVGDSWLAMLGPALESADVQRSQVRVGNAILCRPPEQDLKRIEIEVGRKNKAEMERYTSERLRDPDAAPPKLTPLPQECCRPQLIQTIASAPNVLVAGKTAWASITGESRSMQDIRGAFVERHLLPSGAVLRPVEVPGGGGLVPPPPTSVRLRLTPTWNPAYALRDRRWEEVFHHDVHRWVRWVRGELSWTPAKLVRNPGYALLERFLYSPHAAYLAVDIETDAIDDSTTNIRCIGFSDGEYAFVVHMRSVRPPYKLLGDEPEVVRGECAGWYSPEEARAIRDLIRRYLLDPRRHKVGHNFGYFDSLVLLRVFGIEQISNTTDSILLFRAAYTELPRGLYTLGTLFTDVPDWKATNDDQSVAEAARTDHELAVYNGTDVVVNHRCMPRLFEAVRRRKQAPIMALDHRTQQHCRDMHRLGFRIDQPKRAIFELEHRQKAESRITFIRDAVGDSKYNPNSPQQLARLLHGEMRLPVLGWTKSFDPSTDDDVLREIIVRKLGSDRDRAIVQAHRALRSDVKRVGAITPLRMWNDYRKNSDGHLVGGLCRPDGRVHPHYNAHTPATGRASSSDPNSQNWEKFIRELIIPEDGHIYVGADYDQIELRLIAGVAKVRAYIDVFNAGGDPHAVTAKLIYGNAFQKLFDAVLCPVCTARYKADGIMRKPCKKCKESVGYTNLRNFAKTFVYAVIYGATPETLYASVASAEDPKTGELAFPDMTLAMVAAAHRSWMSGAPEIPAYWDKLKREAQQFGYVTEPIGGRVRDVPNGPDVDLNKILNMPIQGGAAIIVSKALDRAVQLIPFDFVNRTGLINYMHDALTFECRVEAADEVVATLNRVLPAREAATPDILYSADAHTAPNLMKAA